jgi:hypothetical protein
MKGIQPKITHGTTKSNFEYVQGICKENALLGAPGSDNVYSTTDTLQEIFLYARIFKTSH